MSITQTYYLAHKARAKLSNEASMPDHNLRLLVGHANLLDSLMLELADAEREQESWFNQSVRTASQPEKKEERHIQWADTIAEEEYEDDSSDESEDEDDSDLSSDEDVEMADAVSLRRVPSLIHDTTANNTITFEKVPASLQMEVVEIDMEGDFEQDDYEDEDYAQLELTRTHSHHSITSPPPELEHDMDESSEDEAMPPSPPSSMLPTFEQEHNQKDSDATSAGFYNETIQHHYMPARNPARLVSAISVY